MRSCPFATPPVIHGHADERAIPEGIIAKDQKAGKAKSAAARPPGRQCKGARPKEKQKPRRSEPPGLLLFQQS
jgi:hypothetical protein